MREEEERREREKEIPGGVRIGEERRRGEERKKDEERRIVDGREERRIGEGSEGRGDPTNTLHTLFQM